MKFGDASGCLDAEFNPFIDVYLGEILSAVTLAWSRMKPAKQRGLEDQITLALAGRLRHDPAFANLPFDVAPQYWLTDIDGRRLGRLDLHFKYRASQRDYFAFESKRLHVSYPSGKIYPEYDVYAGNEGMGAFIEGQYSKGLACAGMLAYVMDGKTDKAWIGIATRIHAKRKELCLPATSAFDESLLNRHVKCGLPGTCLGETQQRFNPSRFTVAPSPSASDAAVTMTIIWSCFSARHFSSLSPSERLSRRGR